MKKKIIFSAGGTGGHILPAINLMEHFSERGYEVLLVTDTRGKKFLGNSSQFRSYIIKAETFTNKSFFKKPLSFLVILYSLLKSIIILKKEKPDLVFGLGGYVSFPISFTSRFFSLPLVIYENNLILGRANKFLVRLSKKIFLSHGLLKNFPQQYQKKVYEVGPILNKEIINFQKPKTKNKENKFSILVLGGSQGTELFGKIIPPVISMVKNQGYDIQINQQCILSQKKIINEFYEKNKIKNYIFQFDKNILKLILSSDFAITRCGASTTAELAHTSTPFIAVPLLRSIDNHQYLNAKYYEKRGLCWLLEESNFTTKKLFNLIMEILTKKNNLINVSKNIEDDNKKNVYYFIEKEVKNLI